MDQNPRPKDAGEALLKLAATVVADDALGQVEMGRIHDAAVAEAVLIQGEQAWAETAHVHHKAHVSITTTAPAFKGQPKDEQPESVDASGFVCHDCGRALIADVGLERILVCPRLHGRRPRSLALKGDHDAVECGRP